MNRLEVRGKPAVYFGAILIVAGIFFKWFVEWAFVPDHRILLASYLVLVYASQALAIAAGTFLLIKQPGIAVPRKIELALPQVNP